MCYFKEQQWQNIQHEQCIWVEFIWCKSYKYLNNIYLSEMRIVLSEMLKTRP